MELFEIIVIAIGLAMDAFAVSVCKGLSMKKIDWEKAIIIAVYFGAFQAIMPVFGYFLGSSFSIFVQKVDHWIAFILLSIIGANMVKESTDNEVEKRKGYVNVTSAYVREAGNTQADIITGLSLQSYLLYLKKTNQLSQRQYDFLSVMLDNNK